MGYRGAWIAFADIEKAEVLSRLSLRDTGAPDDTGMEPFAGGMTAAGWYVVLAYEGELDMDFSLAKLSAGCRLIGVEVFEGVMTSQAQAFEDGNKLWELIHIGDEGLFDLYAEGALSPEFTAIKQQRFDEQTANGGEDANVDYVYEIPADTAAAITGYRPDGDNLGEDDPLPEMTILEPV